MEHSFDVSVANEVGMASAVIFQNIMWWIAKNEANEQNFYDGEYWTYNSIKAYAKQFPYLSEKQVRTSLTKLKDEGYIRTGNYNENPYDRTLWYGLGDKGKSIYNIWQAHFPYRANENASEGKPIPYSKPDINSDTKKYENISTFHSDIFSKESAKKARFVPPTLEEVRAYCEERGNSVDPEAFVAFYESKGWMVGKSPMKSWKAAVVTFERNERAYGRKEQPNPSKISDRDSVRW